MKKITFLPVLVFLFSISSFSQKADISLRLKKGDKFDITTQMHNSVDQEVMGNKMSLTQNYTVVMGINVTDILPDGNYKIEQKYKRIKLDMTMNGQQLNYDSNAENAGTPLASLDNIKGAMFSYEVSPKGKIINIKGLDDIKTKLASSPQTQKILSSLSNKKQIESIYGYIPDSKVSNGDTYSKDIKLEELYGVSITMNYAVIEITKENIDISLDSDFDFNPKDPIVQNGVSMNLKGKGVQAGNYQITRKTGFLKSSDIAQQIEMNISMKNPQTGGDVVIPMKVNSTIKQEVTPL